MGWRVVDPRIVYAQSGRRMAGGTCCNNAYGTATAWFSDCGGFVPASKYIFWFNLLFDR